jgi:formylglycine-generating enzyme required for sulfatase activity
MTELTLPPALADRMEFVLCPPSPDLPLSFRMGARGARSDEEPVHLVRFSRPFYIGVFPVTEDQYKRFSPRGRSSKIPATEVSWHTARQFCEWLTKSLDLVGSDLIPTLPSEAQWEYACRAGSETEYSNGDGEAALRTVGWFADHRRRSLKPKPVGGLRGNAWGLFDMHGNVREWCLDAWDGTAYRKRAGNLVDPVVTRDTDSNRVLRGGSWVDMASGCRSARRYWRYSGSNLVAFGFRVCLSPGPVAAQELLSRMTVRLPEQPAIKDVGGRGVKPHPPMSGRAGGGHADDLATGRLPLPPS